MKNDNKIKDAGATLLSNYTEEQIEDMNIKVCFKSGKGVYLSYGRLSTIGTPKLPTKVNTRLLRR